MIGEGGASHRESVRSVFAGFLKPTTGQPRTESSSTSSSTPSSTHSEQSRKTAEEIYISSLSECIPWNAAGGKSGSTFSKTKDQRFILKEISKTELKHFVTFARDYVKYCEDSLAHKRPSTFVRIVGCYELAVSNSIHNILVMENLFYECNIAYIYDLKGSMRNRKVDISPEPVDDREPEQASGEAPEKFTQTTTVLMDENLRHIMTMHPLYVHVHSKRVLLEALQSDTDFLRSKGVMDYSLLVGIDKDHSEYVVGIIDYVRLFDLTKEIEFRMKKLGKSIDPTIIRPGSYQKRFLDAMQEYFNEVPDKWLKQIQWGTLRDNDSEDSLQCPPPTKAPINDDDIVSFATFRQIDS